MKEECEPLYVVSGGEHCVSLTRNFLLMLIRYAEKF